MKNTELQSNATSATLPTEDEVIELKKELNFLLWTHDAPTGRPASAVYVPSPNPTVWPSLNLQCAGHAIVTSCVLMRRGFDLISHWGESVFIHPSADGNTENDVHRIGRHYWVSVEEHGLVDLSLQLAGENPLIWCNRSVGGSWNVEISDREEKLARFIEAIQRGCFYLTLNSKYVTKEDAAEALTQEFRPAKKRGIVIQYAKLVDHCESLLNGAAQSLTGLPQIEAWRRLAN